MAVYRTFSTGKILSRPQKAKTGAMNFHDFSVTDIEGKEIDFARYKGRKVLIVNTASECGYTPQYAQLEELHRHFKDKLAVLGFPSNDFGKQEPGTEEEIAAFCKMNYNIGFHLFQKISVTGQDQHPLYRWLTHRELNGWNNQEPVWNFCKYLVDENGKLIRFFSHKVGPLSEEILSCIGE